MAYLVQVQRGIDYIEAHLDQPITPRDVTGAAGLSHWHYQRIFRALTGDSLHAYIRDRRLAGAALRLRQGNDAVLDIALRAGFGSQAAFTRAFKRAFGMPPGAYRGADQPGPALPKATLDVDAIRHLGRNLQREPTLRELPERTILGLSTPFDGVRKNALGEQLPSLWGRFLSHIPTVPQAAPGVAYGVVLVDPTNADALRYIAGCEVPSNVPIPDGWSRVVVPAATYACFEHRGSAANVDHSVNYAYGTWLTQSRCRHTGGPDLEIYDDRYVADAASSAFDYAIPVSEAPG